MRFTLNPFRASPFPASLLPLPGEQRAFHRTLPGYAPTPLVELPHLASRLGVGRLFLKDESARFGLNAFKVLGAAYAIHRVMEARPEMNRWTFASATDGNHGRAVAWAAKRLGHGAVIFVPRNTVRARIDAIRGEGAEVVVVDGTYDDAVARAAAEAATHGWQVVSDTAWPGYTEIPGWIMSGYATLFDEVEESREAAGAPPFDAMVIQAGVGGLAFAAAIHAARLEAAGLRRPALISVEPVDADCLFESAISSDGSAENARGAQNSIMAGLNCGTPSLVAWPAIRAAFDAFLAIDDDFARDAMRMLSNGQPRVVSGESGAAGLAGLLALTEEPTLADARASLPIGSGDTVLIVNTEGATDPESFERITVTFT